MTLLSLNKTRAHHCTLAKNFIFLKDQIHVSLSSAKKRLATSHAVDLKSVIFSDLNLFYHYYFQTPILMIY